MTPDEIDAFLAVPRDGVLSHRRADGTIGSTPIWFRWSESAAGDGRVVRFQSPTTSLKTRRLRADPWASLCVHSHDLPQVAYVTVEGPVEEVAFDLERDIGASATDYMGDRAEEFMNGIRGAIESGRSWASFEMRPDKVLSSTNVL